MRLHQYSGGKVGQLRDLGKDLGAIQPPRDFFSTADLSTPWLKGPILESIIPRTIRWTYRVLWVS